ncbi:MAG: Ig-like domain-containing protein [Scandinavium sp.]|uniref:Ig-like domain-containing protein n=1 Tax=Scandinavium sp. TaxID=2830653 RepID=UPI003F2E37AE
MTTNLLKTQNDLLAAAAVGASVGAAAPNPPTPGIINIDSVTDDQGTYIGPVSDGGLTDDLTPTLSGHTPEAPNLKFKIYANTEYLGSVVSDKDGYWSFTPDQPLEANQTYIFEVIVQDPGGQTLFISLPYTINTTEINADDNSTPHDLVLTDNVSGGISGALQDGDTTNDNTPTLSGKGAPGDIITIMDNGKAIGIAKVEADGSWSFTPDARTDGLHEFSAVAHSSTTGKISHVSETIAVTVDTYVGTPAISAITDNVGTNQGLVFSGGLTDDTQPKLSGTGEPGSTLHITMYGPKSNVVHNIATVHVDDEGNWSYQFSANQQLQSGENVFHISATDEAGNVAVGEDFVATLVAPNEDSNPIPYVMGYEPFSEELTGHGTNEIITGTGLVVKGLTGEDIEEITYGSSDGSLYHGNDGSDAPVTSFTLPMASDAVTIDYNLALPGSKVIFFNENGDIIGQANAQTTSWENGNETVTFTAPEGEHIASFITSGIDPIDTVSWGFHELPLVSGSETFSDNLDENSNHVIITSSGLVVEGLAGSSMMELTYNGDTDGSLYHNNDQMTSFTLPGVSDTVTIDYNSARPDATVEFFNADGESIGTTEAKETDWEYGNETVTFSAPEGEHIASFITHGIDPIDTISWEAGSSATADIADLPTSEPEFDNSVAQLANGHADTVHITADDILTNGQEDLMFRDGNSQLAVRGDEGDTVVIESNDVKEFGALTAGGVTYDVYHLNSEDVDVLVQQGVTVHHG